MRLGRWQQVLVDALVGQPAIGVRVTVEAHLGRPPTRAELNAARRAAGRLGPLAQVVHLEGLPANEDRLILIRAGVQLDQVAMRRAAAGLPPTPAAQGTGGSATAKSALTSAQKAAEAARRVDVDRVSLDLADELSIELDDAIEALVKLSRGLRRRAFSQAWMKPTDRVWQQRWAEVVAYHDRTGRWPPRNSTDPDVKSLAAWVGFQRRQYLDQRLSPDREAAMRAAGFRFAVYRGHRAADDDPS